MAKELYQLVSFIDQISGTDTTRLRQVIQEERDKGTIPETVAPAPRAFQTGLGRLSFTPLTRQVVINEEVKQLTPVEASLFDVFTLAPNVPIAWNKLNPPVWENANDRNAVRLLVKRIRQRIGDNSENPQCIVSVRGTGYIFIGTPVTE